MRKCVEPWIIPVIILILFGVFGAGLAMLVREPDPPPIPMPTGDPVMIQMSTPVLDPNLDPPPIPKAKIEPPPANDPWPPCCILDASLPVPFDRD